MKRREVIKLVSLTTGAALSAPLLGSLMSGCTKDILKNNAVYQQLFFNEDEFSLVHQIVDIILPKTDSPSASDVGVDQMIDQMIAKTYKKKDQDKYRKNFESLYKHIASLGKFADGNMQDKTNMLSELSVSKNKELDAAKNAFLDLKQQTIAYYLSTEEISKNHLNYLPVPGPYEPCISLEEVNNKAWAL